MALLGARIPGEAGAFAGAIIAAAGSSNHTAGLK
jgi:hypothetical protein